MSGSTESAGGHRLTPAAGGHRLTPAAVPRPEWSPVPRPGCRNVEGKVLVRNERVLIAMLRFAEHGTIDPHAAPHEIDVVCLEGHGFASVGAHSAPFRAGEQVRWPVGEQHCLWTTDSVMTTLMVEYIAPDEHSVPEGTAAQRAPGSTARTWHVAH